MENQRPFHLQLRYERELRGWSQANVAEKVGSDVKTVGRWEKGLSVPRPYYRQKLYEIFGKDAQTMGLLASTTTTPPVESDGVFAPVIDAEIVDVQEPGIVAEVPVRMGYREDWGEAPRFPLLYGRVNECAQLLAWIQQDRCRVVAVSGIGGVGKTTLLSTVVEQGKATCTFDAVFWRSVHNAPPPEQYLKSAIRFFSPQQYTTLPDSVDDLI